MKQPEKPMTIDKDSKAALEAQLQKEKQARAQQCLDAIKEHLTEFDCELLTTSQRIGKQEEHGWVVIPK